MTSHVTGRRWLTGIVIAGVAVLGTPVVGQAAPEPVDLDPAGITAEAAPAGPAKKRPVKKRPVKKQLIELSWSSPDAATFRRRVSTVEQLRLFSGTHLRLATLDDSRVFGAAVPRRSFAAERRQLRAAKPTRMTENFIRVNSARDENWDWFDDATWADSLSNIRNVARTAAAGPVRGITLDPEAYGLSPWSYREQLGAGSHTFREYEAEVQARGAEFARTVVAEDPDLQIYSLGLYTWVKDIYAEHTTRAAQRAALREHGYGLLPAFINGLIEGSGPNTLVTDGNELSYYATNADQFRSVEPYLDDTVAPVLLDRRLRGRYDRNFRIGHAVYTDLALDLFDEQQNPGYYGVRPPHFMSEADRLRLLQQNAYYGLKFSDKYVWVYSEDIANDRNFDYGWGETDVPDGVVDVLRRAKKKVNRDRPLGFDLSARVEAAKTACRDATGGLDSCGG